MKKDWNVGLCWAFYGPISFKLGVIYSSYCIVHFGAEFIELLVLLLLKVTGVGKKEISARKS